jgi:hypothetical protein
VPFIFIAILLSVGRESLAGLILATVIIAVLILPFSLYNEERFDQFVLLNTNAGFAFFWANHPIHGAKFIPILSPDQKSYQDLIPLELRTLSEAALDRSLLSRGLHFVADDPVRYIKLTISRIPAYFKFWPSRDSSTISNIARVGSFGLLLPWFIAGIFLSIQSTHFGDKRWIIVYLLLLVACVYTGIHLLSWSLIRYRLPVDAVLMPFAGYGIFRVAEIVR